MAVNGFIESSHREPRSPVNHCLCSRLLLAGIVVAIVLAGVLSDVPAANKYRNNNNRNNSHYRNRNRSAAAAASARKAQLVNTLQRQVATARQMLAAAESNTAMSQAEVNQALVKLSGIRVEIESAEDDVVQALKTQHAIEAEILAEQAKDSELAKALVAEAQAKEEIHLAIHGALHLPGHEAKSVDTARLVDVATLSDIQKRTLEEDQKYRVAKEALKETAAQVERLQQKLFQDDPDWIAAQRDLSDARQRELAGEQHAKTVGGSSFGDKQALSKSKHVADAARALVNQGEARLRQLGAKPTSRTNSSRSTQSQKPKKTK